MTRILTNPSTRTSFAPFDLSVLLHYHLTPEEYPLNLYMADGRRQYDDAVKMWLRYGMLENFMAGKRHRPLYATTEKARIYIEHLLSRPVLWVAEDAE